MDRAAQCPFDFCATHAVENASGNDPTIGLQLHPINDPLVRIGNIEPRIERSLMPNLAIHWRVLAPIWEKPPHIRIMLSG